MSFEVRTEIAGLEPEAKRALVEIQTAVKREFAAQEQRVTRPKRHVTELHQSNVIAKPGQVVRVAPGDEDITVYMPEPDPGNGGEDIIISVEGDGTALGNVKVEPLNGTCENPGIETLYNPGTYRYTSTGAKNESASGRGGSWGGPAPTAMEELPELAPQRLLGNNAVGTAAPSELTASQVLDWVDNTRGTIATRGAASWVGLDPGTIELPVVSKGPGADPIYQRLANAGLATVPTATFKGRTTASTGDVEDLTATQATALLNSFAGSVKGLVPASAGGTVNYLRADGSFAVPPGTFLTTAIPVSSPILNTAGTIGFDQTVTLGNNARIAVRVNSAGTPSVRRRVNFISGTNVTVAQVDDAVDEEVDVTINATDTNTTYTAGDTTIVLTGTAFTRAAVTGDVAIAAGSNTSVIGAGVIVDADVNAAAAIDLTKTGALTGDVTKASGSATTAIAAGVIVDADVNASAAIAMTKTGALTGDVTKASGSATTVIATDAVANSQLANMATPRLKGRTSASTGDPEDLTLTSSTSITWNTGTGGAISTERAALTGDVTASANSNTTAIAAGVIVDADVNASAAIDLSKTGALTGDVTKASGSSVTAIAADAVTNADLANMASPRLKGRTTATTGDPEDLTLTNSTTVTWNTSTGGTLSTERAALTGDVTASANSNTTAIAAGVIVDADVNASAAIAQTKTGALTGEVTKSSGSATTAIDRATNFVWTGTHEFDNDATFDDLVDIGHQLRLSGIYTSTATGTSNNVAVGNVSVAVFTPGGTHTVTGIVPPTAGQPTVLLVLNGSPDETLTLAHESGSSTAANRMLFPNESDCDLGSGGNGYQGLWLFYNPATSRWHGATRMGTDFASASEQRTATSLVAAVAPGTQQYHPSASKFWVVATGGTAAIDDSYNVTSTTDTGVGRMTVTTANDFTSANWCCQVSIEMIDSSPDTAAEQMIAAIEGTKAAGSVVVSCTEPISAWPNQDPFKWHVLGFGDF